MGRRWRLLVVRVRCRSRVSDQEQAKEGEVPERGTRADPRTFCFNLILLKSSKISRFGL